MEERAGTLTDSSSGDRPPNAQAGSLESLSRVERRMYAALGELARGGRGRIWRARDRRTDRLVAVKEPIDERPETRARFAREALVTARLQHPSIVPVYEAGTFEEGSPFYAMKLVEGRSLREAISAAHQPSQRLALLAHVIAVADAVAYAHGEGVMHRDLKPSNVLCGPFGETVVVDWGLAKVRGQELGPAGPFEIAAHDLTLDGAVVGTPAYMAPEQARGEALDERADVYAIGAILFHLLAGRAPYEGSSSDEVLEQVLAGPTPALPQSAAPEDLAAIVRRAMARERSDRYPSARDLAEDLRRYTTGKLVSAHDYSAPARVLRWLRGHRALVRLAFAALLVLVVLGWMAAARIVKERDTAHALASSLILSQAHAALDRDPAAALAWLKTYPQDGADWPKARALAIDAASRRPARHVFRHEAGVGALAFSADGALFALGGGDLALSVRDTTDGKLRARFKLTAAVTGMERSPDGRTLAAIDQGGGLHLVELPALRRSELHLAHGPLFTLAFAPDGGALVAGGEDGVPYWVKDGTVTALGAGGPRLTALAFAGEELAAGDAAGAVSVWPLRPGAAPRVVARHAGAVFDLVVSKGRIVSAGEDATLRISSPSGQEAREVPLGAGAVDLALSADGEQVAVACKDQRVRLVQLPPPEQEERAASQGLARAGGRVHPGRDPQVLTMDGLGADAFAVDLSPDGRWMAASAVDGSLVAWDLRSGMSRRLLGHGTGPMYLGFSRDGAQLGSGGGDGSARLWPMGQEEGETASLSAPAVHLALSPGGSVALASQDGTLSVLEGGRLRTLARGDVCSTILYAPDQTTLLAAGWDRRILAFERSSDQARVLAENAGVVWSLATHGAQLAAAGTNGIRVWEDLQSGPRALVGHQGDVRAVLYSADGRWLYSGGHDGTLRLWDLRAREGESRVLATETAEVYLLALSGDGTQLAAVTLDGVTLWDTRTWAQRKLVTPGRVRWVAFSPDGRSLAATTARAELPVWDTSSGALHLIHGPREGSNKLAFTGGGRRLVSTGRDGTVRVWELETGRERIAHRFQGMALDVASDGQRIAASGADRGVWIGDGDGPITGDGPQAVGAALAAGTSAVIDAEGEATTVAQ